MKRNAVFIWIIFASLGAGADQAIVFSGGGSPAGNHYSQFLQTRTLYNFVSGVLSGDSSAVFFGAGNSNGQEMKLGDVHKVEKSDGLEREIFIPGYIAGNQEASKQNILNRLDKMKTTASFNENLFVLISDHGMPNRNDKGVRDQSFSNNCIDTWAFQYKIQPGTEDEFWNLKFPERCLSRSELQDKLEALSFRKIVFAMSQCYSGGFHQMAIGHQQGYPIASGKICGFTAITKDTTASGCTPDVDGPNYQGYERFFTEALSGVDVVTGARISNATLSIQEAHRKATARDLTKDIPLASSDAFLLDWYQLISSGGFIPRTEILSSEQALLIANQHSRPGVRYSESKLSTNYLSKAAFFKKVLFVAQRQYPELSNLMTSDLSQVNAELQKLTEELSQISDQLDRTNDRYEENIAELLHAWAQYVASGKSGLKEYEQNIEGTMSYLDQKYGFGAGVDTSYSINAIRAVKEPEKAKFIEYYRAKRNSYAIQWALASRDLRLVSLARRVQQLDQQLASLGSVSEATTRQQGLVRRVLIYRQVLGAWNSLYAMQDIKALQDVDALLGCEATTIQPK